jgi:sigma-B regulation protein RsbU (phosphoserine phosphatase)
MLLSFSRAASSGRARTARSGEVAQREKARLLAVARFERPAPAALAVAQRAAEVAATVLDAPFGLCTIVGERAIRLVGAVGLDGVRELPREGGLCLAAVTSGRARVVERADVDRRTRAHSLVCGPSAVRSYAGVPMLTSDGFEVGTVAAASPEHFVPGPRSLAALEALAEMVAAAFEAEPADLPPLDPLTGLPSRRRLEERLRVLSAERVWERTWGAIAVVEFRSSGCDARAWGAALRAALAGEAEVFTLGDGTFAAIAGSAAAFDPRRLTAPLDEVRQTFRRADGSEACVGIATYDERTAPVEALRLAGWRAYAEKSGLR